MLEVSPRSKVRGPKSSGRGASLNRLRFRKQFAHPVADAGAERREQGDQRGWQLRQIHATHDVVEAHQQFRVIEIVVEEAFAGEARDQTRDSISWASGEAAYRVLDSSRVECGECGIVGIEALGVV